MVKTVRKAPLALIATCLVMLFVLCPCGQAQTNDYPLVAAKECTPRLGLPNLIARANRKGSEVKIGYLGGSITAQPGWRVLSLALLQKTFPNAHFAEINAAIGGTGSDLGVFRLQHDVLDFKPDLLFVEFAVNDGGASPQQITRCMEGIVRQTWHTLPNCDICFVYTVTESLAAPMITDGKFPRAASVMEAVADRYGIPSIHMAMQVAALAKAGKLLWSAPLPKTDQEKAAEAGKVVFAADSVHPYPETGHVLYREAIERSLPGIRAASKHAGKHKLAKPLDPENLERASLVPVSPAVLSTGFQKLDAASNNIAKSFEHYTGGIYRAANAGDKLSFKFKGTYAAVYDIIGPDCGQVRVTIDGGAPRTVARFDSFCTYHRLATLLLASDLKDDIHTVTVEILPDQPDKATILASRGEKMDNPVRFNDRAFYPGALLLVGELIR